MIAQRMLHVGEVVDGRHWMELVAWYEAVKHYT